MSDTLLLLRKRGIKWLHWYLWVHWHLHICFKDSSGEYMGDVLYHFSLKLGLSIFCWGKNWVQIQRNQFDSLLVVEVAIWSNGEQSFEKKSVITFQSSRGLPGGSEVRNPPVDAGTTGTWVQSLMGKISCRRAWQPTPVFLPGESHGQRSLVGYSPQGCPESDNWSDLADMQSSRGLRRWLSGKESTCQWRKLQFDIWARKIP